MTQRLPQETVSATVVNGVYVIRFSAYPAKRDVRAIALKGPAGSTVDMYISGTFVDTTPRGDYNSATAAPGEMVLPRGAVLTLIWSVGTGTPVPFATLTTETSQ